MKSPLFVKKFIDIDASQEKVWSVLTQREYTDRWSKLFSPEILGFHVESEWALKSAVDWLGDDGKILVNGEVTKLEAPNLLQYTTIDVGMGLPLDADENDGIRFELSEVDGKTRLMIIHGDFNKMEDGKKYYDMTVKSWDEILPEIKLLAETS